MEADLGKLERAGTDVVFAPSLEEMYPDGFDTYVDVGRVAARLEGEHRPGHFRGVATVVCKLLAAVRPDRAYFGQKDAQQCVVVKRLNADLDLGAEIVVVPTVREPDGLALSSRNGYLSPSERRAATVVHRALELARSMHRDGVDDAGGIRREVRLLIDSEPLARVDYVSVADPDTLEELELVTPGALVSLAVYVGANAAYRQRHALARIHRRRASGQCPEAARGCSCESGIMVLKQQSRPQNKEHPIDATTQPS